MYADDTIAAIATPPGQGGIGIVRVSGPLASRIGGALFRASARLLAEHEWTSHHLYHGSVVAADGQILDTGLAVLMRSPHSYTGEDVLELHCHGSPVVLRAVLACVLGTGARLAEPGEFTKRAFLNGRIDLVQAEAVIDMVRARSAVGAAVAADQLTGRLSECLATLRGHLIGLKALLEAQIDFSEEDLTVEPADLVAVLDVSEDGIQQLLSTYQRGKIIREGVRVAIVGKPNVGKSSLLNALLGEERAIVTDIAGTTRDVIDETVDFDGIPVVLSDTAGLRDAAEAGTVERIGMARTAAAIATAELVLTVVDASRPLDAQDRALLGNVTKPQIVVLNKTDLPSVVRADQLSDIARERTIVAISATQRRGLAELRHAVMTAAMGGPSELAGGPVVTKVRHIDALEKSAASLRLVRRSILELRPADVVAVDVQDALDHMATITGAISSEDVLDRIFSEFCIGK